MQQSFLNFLFLGRAMIHPAGFAAHPAFRDATARPLIDRRGGLHYDGNSQGGINGGALTAIAQDWTRGARRTGDELHHAAATQRGLRTVPDLLDGYYPDKVDQQLVFALLQMLWDRSEANGYAQHMIDRPLPRTPRTRCCCTWPSATIRSPRSPPRSGPHDRRAPAHPRARRRLVTGRAAVLGHHAIRRYPYTGSAIVVWNSGTAHAPPPTNLAPAGPEFGDDPHEFPRAQAGAQKQKAVFLLTGKVVDVCGRTPCP